MNILLILEDALRPDRLGCYGYDKPTSPWVDMIAGEGAVFTNCFSVSSHTLPPIVSMIMSQWPCTHGVTDPAAYDRWKKSSFWKQLSTPLKDLAARGYAVDGELVMRWDPLGFIKDTPTDEIAAYFENPVKRPWFFMAEPYPTHLPYDPPEEYMLRFLDEGYVMTPGTKKRLQVVQSCLIVHPSGVISRAESGGDDPIPDDDTDEAHKRTAGTVDLLPEDLPAVNACYDGEVRVFDDLVGNWVNALKSSGQWDETLVIITSDHGEELMERGYVGHSSCNLKGTLYDESIRVPLILRYPPAVPAGVTINSLVSHVDLFPTIYDLLGIEGPSYMEGVSLLKLLTGETDKVHDAVFCETLPAGWQALPDDIRCMYGIRTLDEKLILHTDVRHSSRRYELFSLHDDPMETTDCYTEKRMQVQNLCEELDNYLCRKEEISWK